MIKTLERFRYTKTYTRRENFEWVDKIVTGSRCKVYSENPMNIIEERIVTAVPQGAAVYVPKHVKYPRSHLRSYLKTIGARITIKPEDADVALFDPLWYNTVITDHITKVHLVDIYDHNWDADHKELIVDRKNLIQFIYAYTLSDPAVYYSISSFYNQGNRKAFTDIIEFLQCNTDAKFISYDDVFDAACNGNVIDDNQFYTLATAINNDTEIKNAESYLGALSRYSLKNNFIKISALLLLMRQVRLPYTHEFRKYKRSTFYYNLLNRYTEILANKQGGMFRTLRHNSFIAGHMMYYAPQHNVESNLSLVFKHMHEHFMNSDIEFPKKFVEYYIKNIFYTFTGKDAMGDVDAFRQMYKVNTLNFLDEYDRAPYHASVKYFGSRIVSSFSPAEFSKRVVNLQYYQDNKEFIRNIFNSL